MAEGRSSAEARDAMSTLDRGLTLVRDRRARLLAEVDGLLEPQFSAVPGEGEWSTAHVLEHLWIVESYTTKTLQGVIDGRIPGERRLLYRIWSIPPQIVARPVFKVRTIRRVTPAAAPEREDVLERLAQSREQLEALVESSRDRDLSKLRLRHPFLGGLNAYQFIEFLGHHENRHTIQIHQIKRRLAGG
jgi:hypothetical protein